MRRLFKNKSYFQITSIFLIVAIAVTAVTFWQYHNAVRLEASGISPTYFSHNAPYARGDEIVSERTENSKKFYLRNNSYVLDISIGAIHYKDNYANNKELWKDIDLTFQNGQITKAPYILSLNENEKSFIIQDKRTGKITSLKLTKIGDLDIRNISQKTGALSKGKIQWNDIVPDLDIAIVAENDQVSFDWVVKNDKAPHTVEFEVVDGGIPIIYGGWDSIKKPVKVSTQKLGNRVIESIEKGGKYPKHINPIINVQVGADSNDSMIDWDSIDVWAYDQDWATRELGRVTAGGEYVVYGCGFRYTGITIPSSSTITESYLTFTAVESESTSGVKTKITGNKQNNPAAFTTLTDFQNRRGTIAGGANNNYITSTQVNWDDIGSWTANNEYNSPEIKTIIQELVNSHAPNNEALVLFLDDFDKRTSGTAQRKAWAHNYYPSKATKLHIEYSTSPSAPTGMSATDGTYADKVSITWNASSNAISYKVFCNTTSDIGSATQIGTPTETSFDDTGANPGTTYYYWVKAHNDGGDSDYSSYDTGWCALAAPTNVAATDGGYASEVQITWTGSTGATSYKVYRNTSNSHSGETALGTQTSPYDDTSVSPGVTYYYWVKASCANGDSDYSSYDTGYRYRDSNGNYEGVALASDWGQSWWDDINDVQGFAKIIDDFNGWQQLFTSHDPFPTWWQEESQRNRQSNGRRY